MTAWNSTLKAGGPLRRTSTLRSYGWPRKRARSFGKLAIPKELGEMAVSKGPARDPEHLAKVRGERCLACEAGSPIEAHHARELLPRSMGRRVSDYITTPLCTGCHYRLHHKKFMFHHNLSVTWQETWAERAMRFIRLFSPEGAAEIARIGGGSLRSQDITGG
jgi:hypothetical protein